MDVSSLPLVNACLNGCAMVLLLIGRWLARGHRVTAHRRVMIAAFLVSSVFLVLYVLHKFQRGGVHTAFTGQGAWRAAYYAILASHVLLAMAVPVLAVWLIRLGLAGRVEQHRRLARLAWPLWMYVSLTGVLIYLMLYHW